MVCGGSRRRPCFSYKGNREEYVVLIEHLIDYASSTLSLSKTQDHQIQFIGAYLRLIGLFRSAWLDGQPICIINRGWIWWWVNEQQQQQQQPTNDEILNLSPRIIPKMIIINWFPLVLPSTVGCRRELAPLSSNVFLVISGRRNGRRSVSDGGAFIAGCPQREDGGGSACK